MKSLILVLFFIGFAVCDMYGQVVTATYEEVVNKQKKGDIDEYILQSGERFSVGDTIFLGKAMEKGTYEFIQQNAGLGVYYPLTNYASGSFVVIKKIKIAYNRVVNVLTSAPKGIVFGLIIMNFENAVNNGEIQSKMMTSDQALSELKKLKDKLDLQIINEDEYNTKRIELIKYIK